MTWIRSNARPLIGLLVVIVAVLLAILITAATPPRQPHVVKLIPVAYRAPTTGGGSIPVPHYFVRALRHHIWCGAPTTPAKRGIHGVFRQRFQHCEMAIGPVKVYRLQVASATPRPSVPPAPPVSQGPPVLPSATASPSTWHAATPVSIPALLGTETPTIPQSFQTPVPSDPTSYELSLMNATRAQYGLPAYSLDTVQSNGTSSCGGSIGHSQDMAASGTIWHVNSSYPQESFPNNFCGSGYRALGENVGMAGGYSVTGSLDVIHNSMMQEPHSLGCQGNHACSIISQQYTRVGIGVYTANGSTWLTVDFEA